jgi:hypothetical protein
MISAVLVTTTVLPPASASSTLCAWWATLRRCTRKHGYRVPNLVGIQPETCGHALNFGPLEEVLQCLAGGGIFADSRGHSGVEFGSGNHIPIAREWGGRRCGRSAGDEERGGQSEAHTLLDNTRFQHGLCSLRPAAA